MSLGRIPLTREYRVIVPIDGIGADEKPGQHLLFAYGAEVFWRAAVGEPLPPVLAERLEEAAWGLSDADVQNVGGDLGVAGPIDHFAKIGRDLHEANVPGAMGDVFDLAQDQALTDWLVSQGLVDEAKMQAWVAATQAADRAAYVAHLTTELADLPLRFSVEALAAGGATSGLLEFHVPDDVAKAAASQFSARSQPSAPPPPALAGAGDLLLLESPDGHEISAMRPDGSGKVTIATGEDLKAWVSSDLRTAVAVDCRSADNDLVCRSTLGPVGGQMRLLGTLRGYFYDIGDFGVPQLAGLSPDGTQAWYAEGDAHTFKLSLLNLRRSDPPSTLAQADGEITAPVFSADGWL